MGKRRALAWTPAVVLLLLLWATRLPALDALPLHLDEGIHLTRAVEVWRLHPFWDISDGKIVNHWLIAAFYPQNAPVFVGRVATALVALLGLAGGYALARNRFGAPAGLLAGALWIASPYAFFFERLALPDAQIGALVALTLWASVRLARRGRARDAVIAGLALALAVLFKFTAAPFVLAVVLIVATMGRAPWRQRVRRLGVIAAVGLACFAAPLAYLALRAEGFDVVLGRLAGSEGLSLPARLGPNLARVWAQLWEYGPGVWAALLLVGLATLALARTGRRLLLAWAAPSLALMAAASELWPRHILVIVLPALALAGAGWGVALARLGSARWQWAAAGGLSVALLAGFLPYAATAYRDPGALALPAFARAQYVTGHAAGFGIREAVAAFPETVPPGAPLVASMFPASCRRANFYATHGIEMACPPPPGLDAVAAALAEHGTVYVLAEAPPIGLDIATLDAHATRVAGYPRPGEAEATASVVLWRLDVAQTPPTPE